MQASVVLPARDDRERLARSLSSLAAQAEPPARVVVVDAGSADGTRDWLRLRWPSVEQVRLPERDPPPSACLDAALARIDTELTAFLPPGDLWAPDALVRAHAAAAEAGAAGWLLRAERLARRPDRPPVSGQAEPGPEPPLSTLICRTDRLRRPPDVAGATLPAEILARLGEAPRRLIEDRPSVTLAALPPAPPAADPARWGEALAAASAGLGDGRGPLVLVGLDAADRPAGLLDMLGHALALALGASAGRTVDAFTLADLDRDRIESAPSGAPLVVATTSGLGPGDAALQVCLEGLLRQAHERPVRLALRRLAPSTLALGGRLVEAVARHPDLELWVADRVSRSYAASLLGPSRVRLTPPGIAGLSAVLDALRGRYAGLVPAVAAASRLAAGPDAMLRDLDAWHAGADREATARLGSVLARLAGVAHLLRTPALEEAWSLVLPGWSALADPGDDASAPLATASLDAALFAALCGRPCVLTPSEPGAAALCETWAGTLGPAGLALATASGARNRRAAPEGRAFASSDPSGVAQMS